MIYSNNDTIVTVKEFLHNSEILIKGTVARKARLILLDGDEHDQGEELARFSWEELTNIFGG
jgi:hypothetical protein